MQRTTFGGLQTLNIHLDVVNQTIQIEELSPFGTLIHDFKDVLELEADKTYRLILSRHSQDSSLDKLTIAQIIVPNITTNPLFYSKTFDVMGFTTPIPIATTFYYVGCSDTKARFWRPSVKQTS